MVSRKRNIKLRRSDTQNEVQSTLFRLREIDQTISYYESEKERLEKRLEILREML